ncbi:hypothetical protein QE152_g22364 [Popillia japonica]|uniref:Uncharacterized protein n=1 Tax=Popillia japonica TaxID=7064 RepID=A0AAW1KKK4_POPJA
MSVHNGWQLHRVQGGNLDHLEFRRAIASNVLETNQRDQKRGLSKRHSLEKAYSTFNGINHIIPYQESQQRCGKCHKKVQFRCEKCILQNDFHPQVIVNGFRKWGLCPFDEEAIDYTKCSNEIIPSGDQETSKTAQHVANHRYLEQLIALFGLWEKSQHLLTRPVAEGVDQFSGASTSQCSTVIESIDDDLLMLCDNPEALDIQRINERRPETIAAIPDNPEILNINPVAGRNTESIPVLDTAALKSELAQMLSPETSGKDVPSPFKNNLFWPLPPKSSNVVRRKIKLPEVVTSEKWRAYEESQIRKNAEEERLKDERKKAKR